MGIDEILALLPTLITGANDIYALIQKITASLKQNTELTPEQQAAFDAHIADLESQPWWSVTE